MVEKARGQGRAWCVWMPGVGWMERMEGDEFGEVGRRQNPKTGLLMRRFKLYPESKTGEGIEGS